MEIAERVQKGELHRLDICEHCQTLIYWWPANVGWYHSETADVRCWEGLNKARTRATPGRKS